MPAIENECELDASFRFVGLNFTQNLEAI